MRKRRCKSVHDLFKPPSRCRRPRGHRGLHDGGRIRWSFADARCWACRADVQHDTPRAIPDWVDAIAKRLHGELRFNDARLCSRCVVASPRSTMFRLRRTIREHFAYSEMFDFFEAIRPLLVESTFSAELWSRRNLRVVKP